MEQLEGLQELITTKGLSLEPADSEAIHVIISKSLHMIQNVPTVGLHTWAQVLIVDN